MLASLDPHDDLGGHSFNGMVLESDERIHIDAGILLHTMCDCDGQYYMISSHPLDKQPTVEFTSSR